MLGQFRIMAFSFPVPFRTFTSCLFQNAETRHCRSKQKSEAFAKYLTNTQSKKHFQRTEMSKPKPIESKLPQGVSRARRRPPLKFKHLAISRLGRDGLTGQLQGNAELYPTTIQILEEINFLPKKVSTEVCEDGNVLKPQPSLLPTFDSIRYGEDTFGHLGLSGQNFSPIVSWNSKLFL